MDEQAREKAPATILQGRGAHDVGQPKPPRTYNVSDLPISGSPMAAPHVLPACPRAGHQQATLQTSLLCVRRTAAQLLE